MLAAEEAITMMVATVAGSFTVVAHPVGPQVSFEIACPVQLEDGTVLACVFQPGRRYQNLQDLAPGDKIDVEQIDRKSHVLAVALNREVQPVGPARSIS